MRYRRISADCHIDFPWLPADLFTANASSAMKDRMPYVVEGPDGPYWTTKKGAGLGLVGGLGSSGQKYVPGQNQRVDVMASTGLFADGRKGIRRPADPELSIGVFARKSRLSMRALSRARPRCSPRAVLRACFSAPSLASRNGALA